MTQVRLDIRFFCFAFLFYFFGNTSNAQIIYTQDFTNKIQELDLYFYEPTDDWLHLIPIRKDEIFKYDLMLLSEDEDVDIRIILTANSEKPDLLQHPHLEFTRILTNLASNNPDFDIVVSQLPGETIKDVFNADWALMADFIPKKYLTSLAYGRVYSLFRDKTGIATFVIFSATPELDEIYQRLLSFKAFVPVE